MTGWKSQRSVVLDAEVSVEDPLADPLNIALDRVLGEIDLGLVRADARSVADADPEKASVVQLAAQISVNPLHAEAVYGSVHGRLPGQLEGDVAAGFEPVSGGRHEGADGDLGRAVPEFDRATTRGPVEGGSRGRGRRLGEKAGSEQRDGMWLFHGGLLGTGDVR